MNLQLGAGLVPLNGTTYDAVAPNATVALSWTVPASAGPGSADGAAVAYTYRSSIDPQAHENAGLIGALVVSSPVREAELRLGVYGSSAAGVRALAVRVDFFPRCPGCACSVFPRWGIRAGSQRLFSCGTPGAECGTTLRCCLSRLAGAVALHMYLCMLDLAVPRNEGCQEVAPPRALLMVPGGDARALL